MVWDKVYKNNRIWMALVLLFFVTGIVAGAVYSANTSAATDGELSEYLKGFFDTVKNRDNNFEMFRNSLEENFKLFLIIFVSAFIRFGFIFSFAAVSVKGFISGFTTAAMVKYFGIKGLLVNLCAIPSTLIFTPILLFFAFYSVNFSRQPNKREKNIYVEFIIISVICFSIFCISSFADGYLTTIFMKLIASKFVDF